jgi:hypothetical protein
MKKSIVIILFLLGFVSIQALAQNAKKVFLSAPDSVTPLLTADNKADFFDFLASKMKAEVKNRFQNKSEMTDFSEDFIQIRMTQSSIWQMKLLPVNDSTKVICIVNTLMGPTEDSSIQFYTSKWEPLPADEFVTLPQADQFYIVPTAKDDSDSIYNQYLSLRRQADIFFMKASLSKADTNLTFTYTTPQFLGKDFADKIKTFIRPSLIYRWEKSKYILSHKD